MSPTNRENSQRVVSEIEKNCMARRAGVCLRTNGCLECNPLNQALHATTGVLARWPHLGKRRA